MPPHSEPRRRLGSRKIRIFLRNRCILCSQAIALGVNIQPFNGMRRKCELSSLVEPVFLEVTCATDCW